MLPDKVLCEWGEQHCCIAGWSNATSKLTSLGYYSFPFVTVEVISEISKELKKLSRPKNSLLVGSAFPEMILVPLKYYNTNASFTAALYSTTEKKELADTIEQWQMANVYALPTLIYDEIKQIFPEAQYIHTATAGLKVYNGFIATDSISVHVSPYNFSVLVKKGGQLLLVQMYAYQTPLDVVYFLLKISEEFNLPKEGLSIIVSGLVEGVSPLYEELRAYFQNVQFASTPNIAPDEDYPAHYFTSLYNLSACAL